jgi:signal transduction histidine kinase/CheY-like chemotaxis protein
MSRTLKKLVPTGVIAPPVILLAGIVVTSVVSALLHQTVDSRNRELFEGGVTRTLGEINSRMEAYLALLRGTAGFVNASNDLSRGKFEDYVSRLNLVEIYPGIQGIGYTVRVPEADLEDFEEAAREEFSSFHIWPGHPRKELHTILYLEPLDERNRAAIGYDMFTEEIRREAMIRARDTGHSAASGIVTLVQEIDRDVQSGFLIYLPVYRGIVLPETVEARRELLVGFVYSPYRARDLFEGIFSERLPRVSFSIHDGETADAQNLLIKAEPAGRHNPKMHSVKPIVVAGRPWTISFSSTPALESAMTPAIAPGAFMLGLIISALTAAFFWLQQKSAAEREFLLDAERAAREEAERSGRMKDEFLATLSHELRTPLTAILGWSNLLQQNLLSKDDLDDVYATIHQNSEALAQLIDELLDVNRVMSGKLHVTMEPVNLKKVVEDAVTSIWPQAESKELGVEVDWSGVEPWVTGDKKRLRQIFWNLLTNAVKFTPAQGRIDVACRLIGEDVEIAITDTGQGIEPDFIPHLFDRFRQADSSNTREHRGLGLGLAIVNSLVELHGGEVHAESAGKDKGSKLTVRLPALPETLAPLGADGVSEADRGKQLHGQRILVIEDENDARTLIYRVLQGEGAIVRTADSGAEGLRILSEEKFDLLVSDIGMPGMDGFTLLRTLRDDDEGNNKDVAAIAVTAFARPEDREQALRAGFQKHVSKPVYPDLLVHACRELCGGSKGQGS